MTDSEALECAKKKVGELNIQELMMLRCNCKMLLKDIKNLSTYSLISLTKKRIDWLDKKIQSLEAINEKG